MHNDNISTNIALTINTNCSKAPRGADARMKYRQDVRTVLGVAAMQLAIDRLPSTAGFPAKAIHA